MIEPPSAGRPLDDREAREFERIVRALQDEPDVLAPPAETEADPDPEPLAVAPGRVTWRQVVLVLAASAVFAVITTMLPHPLNLWSPVVVLAAVSVGCVTLGWRRRS